MLRLRLKWLPLHTFLNLRQHHPSSSEAQDLFSLVSMSRSFGPVEVLWVGREPKVVGDHADTEEAFYRILHLSITIT